MHKQANDVTNFYYMHSQVMLILRLRSVTSLTLARANQFNNKLWNTCGNGAITNEAQKVFIETSVELKIEAVKEGVEKISEKKSE